MSRKFSINFFLLLVSVSTCMSSWYYSPCQVAYSTMQPMAQVCWSILILKIPPFVSPSLISGHLVCGGFLHFVCYPNMFFCPLVGGCIWVVFCPKTSHVLLTVVVEFFLRLLCRYCLKFLCLPRFLNRFNWQESSGPGS